jgi:hypothetical protein
MLQQPRKYTEIANLLIVSYYIYHGQIISESETSKIVEPRSGQTKDYAIGICCFSAKHAALRRKSKDWLARNHDNVTEWGDMSFYWYLPLTLLSGAY